MSHLRASAAQKAGIFESEIVPFHALRAVSESSPLVPITITEDDGIRHDATLDSFAKAKPAFPQWGEGKSTGPNSSQVTDGAAAVVLMRRSTAEELGVEVLGKHIATAVTGKRNSDSS
jgi:acetyl-CoA acyltransferase 1